MPPILTGRSRRGVILPAALLLLLGGTLVAATLLVTARSAVLLADGDRHLARSLAWRAPGADSPEPERIPLGGGYLLLRNRVPAVGWSTWSVAWRLDPGLEASKLRAAAETAGGLTQVDGDLRAAGAGDGCPDPVPLALHWTVEGVPPPTPQPALPDFPRLGPVALDVVSRRSPAPLDPGAPLPEGPGVVAVEPEAVIEDGTGVGLLVAPGDLLLRGTAAFTGLVLVAGDLTLDDEATIYGAARVGGRLSVGAGSQLLGCRAAVEDGLLAVDALDDPFPVLGGGFLGRY